MVQSSRTQSIVKGDDVVLTHQIVTPASLYAVPTMQEVMLEAGDTANAFYPLEDLTVTDLIGYPCTPVGSLPSSMVTVTIAGVIAPSGMTPARGSSTFQSGLGRTVRIEITRSGGSKETHYLIQEVDIFERGFPNSLIDTSGGVNPPQPCLHLT